MNEEPGTDAERRLLEHVRRTASHHAIRDPSPVVLGHLAAMVGLAPDACREALERLEASGRIALRVHDGGLLELRPLSDPPGREAPVRRLR